MTNVRQELTIKQIKTLLDSYSFDTNRCNIEFLIYEWLKDYQIEWIYLATIEALYLGRYKVVSIKKILNIWQRLGVPKTHFNGDFERFIGRNLPKHPAAVDGDQLAEVEEPQEQQATREYQDKSQQDLNRKLRNSQISQTFAVTDSSYASLLTSIKKSFPTTKISQPQTYSYPEPQGEFGFISTTAVFEDNLQESIVKDEYFEDSGIQSFSPNPDFSTFFHKLKSFADSQT